MKITLNQLADHYGKHVNTIRNWRNDNPRLYEAMVLGFKKRHYCVDCGLLTVEGSKNV